MIYMELEQKSVIGQHLRNHDDSSSVAAGFDDGCNKRLVAGGEGVSVRTRMNVGTEWFFVYVRHDTFTRRSPCCVPGKREFYFFSGLLGCVLLILCLILIGFPPAERASRGTPLHPLNLLILPSFSPCPLFSSAIRHTIVLVVTAEEP